MSENLHDREFLDRCTVGFDKFAPSLADKTPEWAEGITGISAHRIRALAREMAATRTTVNINWSLQRSHHGEQPFWALVTLASMLGQIGLPGGGFGASYGPTNIMGSSSPLFSGPDAVAGHQRGARLHPGRALHRHAAQSGGKIPYNGQEITYPEIRHHRAPIIFDQVDGVDQLVNRAAGLEVEHFRADLAGHREDGILGETTTRGNAAGQGAGVERIARGDNVAIATAGGCAGV